MKKTIYYNGCGAIYPDGIFSLSAKKFWDETQTDAQDIRRDQVIAEPMPTFGKLNLPDKLAFCASALALQDLPECGGERSGITIAVPYGSLTTDMFFMESVKQGLPSPAYFSATLPSSTIADIAISKKFKGPNRVFSGGDSPVMDSIEAAFDLIHGNKADTVLSLAVWAIDLCNRDKLSHMQIIPNCAFGVLFSDRRLSERSRECSFTINNYSALQHTTSEYNFCIRLTDALIKDVSAVIPFSTDSAENYFEII